MTGSEQEEGESDVFYEAAFGAGLPPGRLPAASTPRQRWLAAVARGGIGYYARARSDLLRLRSGSYLSFSASTEASLVRQMGRHDAAAVLDGAALASARSADERGDALTGLAADALGRGRLRAAGRFLDRLDDAREGSGENVRGLIRENWVRAELCLAAGDPRAARPYADRAAAFAREWTSARHRVKSELVCAATLAGSDRDESAARAATCVAEADRLGLVPLAWAGSMLLAGVDPGAGWDARRAHYAATLARRGGVAA